MILSHPILMKRLLLPLLLLVTHFASAQTSLQFREFTDQQGRTIKATVIRATENEVWIRREDGPSFQVALTTLSKADQEYVARWRKIDAIRVPNALEFSARRFPEGRETFDDGSIRTTRESYGYEITLTNRSPVDLSDLQIDYRFFVREGSPGVTGQKRPVRTQDGKDGIAFIPSRGTGSFRTKTVTLISTKLRPGWVYADGSKTATTDDLRGICVRIMQDGEVIAEFSTPAKLMERETW